MKWTEIDGKRDYECGITHKAGKGEAYDMGYGMGYQIAESASAQTFEPSDFNAWIAGEKLADQGADLPDNAPHDAKRGYNFRQEMNQLRTTQ